MDISSLIKIKTSEMYRQALEDQYISNNSNEQKMSEQTKIFMQWQEDIENACDKVEEISTELKEKFDQFKEDHQKLDGKLEEINKDMKYAEEELNHDDSGVGEVLTASESPEQRLEMLFEETQLRYDKILLQLEKKY
ncbi:uncharacterized protein LOC116344677 [Contarinia nasturtii]|uniref:uncharacterized protein LOC116344677 n=1 Tax=Contarinia nasturtii TaxID=265458 RepID=UPI0012D4595A|nr:uncharacterized protein LOC116344677 [Contarinia nasturtii]